MKSTFVAPDFSTAVEIRNLWFKDTGMEQSEYTDRLISVIAEPLKELSGKEITTLQLSLALFEGRQKASTAFLRVSDEDLDMHALTLLHPYFFTESWIIDDTRDYFARLKRGEDIVIEE